MSGGATLPQRSGYLPSLDGWRAVAILSVMSVHDYTYRPFGVDLGSIQGLGGFGLHLFFAISGILICTRILEEEDLVGRFSLKGFYIRRFLRIQPAALVYLVTGAVAGLVLVHEQWRFWFGALLFYRNYLPNNVPPPPYFTTGHFWTLAVEEHFYLLLSLLIFVTGRRYRVWLMAVLVLICFEIPRIGARHHWVSPEIEEHVTQNVLLYLIWPAFLAMALRIPRVRRFALRFLHPWTVTAVALAYLTRHYLVSAPRSAIAGPFPENRFVPYSVMPHLVLLFPLWVISAMIHPKAWTTRFLELPPLRYIGRISYSLYLWHVLFFVVRFSWPTLPNRQPYLSQHAPVNYLFALALAAASYYGIEKPLMRLGHRLAPPATPGRSDLTEVKVPVHA